MARNGIYLARAREQIAQRRAENEREHRRRVDDAYRRVPGLRALDQTLQQQMIALVGLTMRHGSDPTEELRALERANLDTQAQRAELLTAYHLPVDYTDDIYSCPRCHDTGDVQGQPCDCLLRRYNAELTRDLSRLLQHGDESFEHFDLTLYDESARPKMERVFQVCRTFAQTFRPGTMNLLLQGGTGLGKTYLSACIARVVAGAGYAVAYETAASENMLFYKGRAHKLSQVTFHIPGDGGKATPDYMRPWTFTSDDGRFEMDYTPVLDRASCSDVGLIKSDQHQVFGVFNGRAVLDDGTVLNVKDLPGFAEKVINKW